MITDIEKKIDELQSAVDEWLSKDNYRLREAIDKTVNEGLFSFEDIKYQLLTLKKTLKKEEFKRWIEFSDADIYERQINSALSACWEFAACRYPGYSGGGVIQTSLSG